ncbi:MAG TPA: RNA polymerase sigma factor [Thermoleophilaceae bacterium]
MLSPADIEALYVTHARRIAGSLMRATGDAEVAADLTAETFAAALLARDRYRSDMGTPATWLYAIAANKLRDWRRRGFAEDRARRRLQIERPALSEGDVAEFGRLADEVTADALLEELPADQRTALRPRAGRPRLWRDRRGRGRLRGSHQTTGEPRAGQPARANWRRPMTDFFGALQLELEAAGRRSPRRRTGLGDMAGVVAAAALVAAAAAVALVVMGGGDQSNQAPGAARPAPVGTVIPKGEGKPPRQARSVVVATGTAPGVGPWQMEASRSSVFRHGDDVIQPAGLRCLSLARLGPRRRFFLPSAGQCGEFPRTPGFSRLQFPAVVMRGDSERAQRLRNRPGIVYGRVPERAARVVVTAPDGLRLEARPHEGPPSARGDFYAISVPRGHRGARVNWLDRHGKPGSRGITLLPPVSRPAPR